MAEKEAVAPFQDAAPDRNLRARAAAGLVWMLSGAGVQQILRLGLMLLLARMLGPQVFGVIAAAMIVINVAMVIAGLGISPALVQRPNLDRAHIVSGFALAIGQGLLVVALIQLLTPTIAGFFDFQRLDEVLRTLAFAPLLHNLGIVAEGQLRRQLKFKPLAMISVGSFAFGWGLVGISLAIAGFGIWALVGAHLAEQAARALFLVLRQPHAWFGGWTRTAAGEILVFSGGYTIRQVGQALAQGIDNLVVGRWLGAEALGLYSRAYQFVSVPPAMLGRAMLSVLFPVMARVQSDPQRLGDAYRRSTELLALITMPVAVTLIVLAPDLVLILLGSAWTGMIVPLQVLAPGVFFRMAFQLSTALGMATGSVYQIAWRQAVHVVAVLAGAWLGLHWGLPGVAAGVLIAQLLHYVLMVGLVRRLTALPVGKLARAHLRGVGLGALIALELVLLVRLGDAFGVPPVLTIVGAIVLVSGSGLAMIRLRWIGPDGLWLLEHLAGRLPPRFSVVLRLLAVTPKPRGADDDPA